MTNRELFEQVIADTDESFLKKYNRRIMEIRYWVKEDYCECDRSDTHTYLLEKYFSENISLHKLLTIFECEIQAGDVMDCDTIDLMLSGDYFHNPKHNLPEWSDELFPKETREHIFEYYIFTNRIPVILEEKSVGSMLSSLHMSSSQLNKIIDSLDNKLKSGGHLTAEDKKVVDYISFWDGLSHYPYHMSPKHIEKTVKEAYINARNANIRQYPTYRDRRNLYRTCSIYEYSDESVLFHGKSQKLNICIWFSFDGMDILTAYPVVEIVKVNKMN